MLYSTLDLSVIQQIAHIRHYIFNIYQIISIDRSCYLLVLNMEDLISSISRCRMVGPQIYIDYLPKSDHQL